MILGPIALLLAWGRVRSEPASLNPEIVDAVPGTGTGPVDVLVGIDGSAESETSATTLGDAQANRLLGLVAMTA